VIFYSQFCQYPLFAYFLKLLLNTSSNFIEAEYYLILGIRIANQPIMVHLFVEAMFYGMAQVVFCFCLADEE
jgi:hypothetical protein